MHHRETAGALVCVMHLLVLSDVTHAIPSRDRFAPCREQLAQKPAEYESAECFSRVALDESMWTESTRVFQSLIDAYPDNFWLPLAYGNAWERRNPDRAEQLYRQAVAGFSASGHAEGELLARGTLRTFLFPRGRIEEAAREYKDWISGEVLARVVTIGRDGPEVERAAHAVEIDELLVTVALTMDE